MSIKKWLKKRRMDKWKRLSLEYDRPIPEPTAHELEQIEKLRESFRQFSKCDDSDRPESEKEWNNNANILRELVLKEDPREFLRWEVIRQAMCVEYAEYTEPEIKYLQAHPQWNCRWKKAIEENMTGHPLPNWKYPQSSSNLIHHAYHVCQFEEVTNKNICDYEYIVEFGGGYGSFCRLIYNLGYKGKYIIFDFPAFSKLQHFYLSALGLRAQMGIQGTDTSRIFCVSGIEQFEQTASQINPDKTLFVATWSLSETPLALRKDLLPYLSRFNSYLIAYQASFREVDNLSFFEEWEKSLDGIDWRNFRIEIMRRHHRYLFGTSKQ